MNILYIAHEGGDNYNGASRSLLTIVKMMAQENTVYVVIPEKGGKLEEALSSLGIEMIQLRYYRWMEVKGRNPIKWIRRVIEWHKNKKANDVCIELLMKYCLEKEIEIIHTNSSVVNIGAILADRINIPHVWHFREFGKEDFGMIPLVSQKEFSKILNLKCNHIVCVSKAVKAKYEQFVHNIPIQVIYNGIDFSTITKNDKIPHKGFNLLVSGLVCKAKGQEIAVKALNSLLNKGYSDMNLFIAGRGTIPCLTDIDSRIKDNVHLLGQVENLNELRKKMDVELVCSRSEAFGRVTIEAMANYLPVIGRATGGTPELITDGYNGFLFSGDYEELAALIVQLYNDKKLLCKMGENAHDSVITTFTEEKVYENVQQLYERITTEV